MSKGKPSTKSAACALALLSDPLDVRILMALKEGPLALADLCSSIGLPPQTTLRTHLRALVKFGVLIRRQDRGFASTASYELTQSGLELQDVAGILARWLEARPGGVLLIGSPEAKVAVKALVGGWSTNMLRALAVKPLSLRDLDRVIANVNYPTLERRLDAMRLLGLVTATPPNGSRPYGVTKWLRESVAPLLAAAKWERRLPGDGPDLSRLDIEAIFLLAAPLLQLSGAPDGLCRIEIQPESGGDAAELFVAVREGRAKSFRSTVRGQTSNWLSGPIAAWFEAFDRKVALGLETRGNPELAGALVTGLAGLIAAPSAPGSGWHRARR